MKYIYLVVVLVFAGFLLGCEMPSSQSSSATKSRMDVHDCVYWSLKQRYPDDIVRTGYWDKSSFKVLETDPYRAKETGSFEVTNPGYLQNTPLPRYSYTANITTDRYGKRTIDVEIAPWGFQLFPVV